MNTITITQLYEQLASKVGKETAENMTSFINHTIKEGMTDNLRMLATRQDLVEGLATAKKDLVEGLASVKLELIQKIGETNEKITGTKSEIIKWMFIFWTGQLAVIFCYMQFFLKK